MSRSGSKHTDDTKKKMKTARQGRTPNKGHHHTPEVREKMSEDRKGNTNALKNVTHCKNGHALTEDNCVISKLKRGHKRCKICANARSREYKEEKRHAKRT